MLSNSGKARTSPLWQLFKRISPGLAKCSVCRKILSFRSSITNLRRHLLLKHGAAFEEILKQYNPNNNVPDEITIIRLITLVKMHPCLWDTRCSSYGNGELQHKAWYTIASKLHPTKDRTEIVAKLSTQFDTLRNEFFSNRRCSFYEELSFMAPTRDDYEQQIPIVDSELCEIEIKEEIIDESTSSRDCLTAYDGTYQNEQRSTEGNANQKLLFTNKEDVFRRRASREECKPPMNSIEATTECNLQLNNVDDNTLFLLSLVGDMRRVPSEFEIDFKAELMSAFGKLVKRYENKN